MSHALLHANVFLLGALVLASTIVVAIALVAERLTRRASAAARHAIVLAALLVSPVLLTAALIDWPSSSPVAVRRASVVWIGGGVTERAAEWPCVLAAVWLSGALVALIRTAADATRWRSVAARAKRIDSDYATSDECAEPTLIGIIKPLIVLPAGHEFTREELEAVFAHERAHVARRDNLIALAVQIVSSLFWFEPLHRIARRRLVELRERVCDDLVLARGCDPAAYAAALARSCEGSFNSPAVACMSRLDLHERMESIMTTHARRRTPAWITRTFVTAAVAAAAIAFAALAPAPRLAAGAAPKRLSENKKITPPKAISRVDAVYTAEAKKKHWAGTCILDVTIDESGAVSAVSVLKAAPHGLDQAAVDAMRRWRFEPATLDGKPVPVVLTITFQFRPE